MIQALYINIKKYIVSFSLLTGLLVAGIGAAPCEAATETQPGCVSAARPWIAAIDDSEHRDLLLRYVRNDCRFAGQWMTRHREDGASSLRKRLCNDLVLIWAHKDCGYFRDYVDPAAYDPCKAWTRQMFRRCMEDDLAWFGRDPESSGETSNPVP